jgi:hypothetical protein
LKYVRPVSPMRDVASTERDLAEASAVSGWVALLLRVEPDKLAAAELAAQPFDQPALERERYVHVKVPSVAAASGLVYVSSVGIFGVIFTPSGVSSGPPSQRVPGTSRTSSAVPGPRSSSAANPSFVSLAARRASARVWFSQLSTGCRRGSPARSRR